MCTVSATLQASYQLVNYYCLGVIFILCPNSRFFFKVQQARKIVESGKIKEMAR
jgi:hypothetical protein